MWDWLSVDTKSTLSAKRCSVRTEEAEIALTTSFLRKNLSVCAVRGQARLLLGRLEVIGPGEAAAAVRRNNALRLERSWANQRRAHYPARKVDPKERPLQESRWIKKHARR